MIQTDNDDLPSNKPKIKGSKKKKKENYLGGIFSCILGGSKF